MAAYALERPTNELQMGLTHGIVEALGKTSLSRLQQSPEMCQDLC